MLNRILELPRSLLWITLAMMVANIGSSMYGPLLPLYLESLGAAVEDIGLFFMIQTVLTICFRIIGGWFSDQVGRLPSMAIGGVIGSVAILGFALASSWTAALIGALFGAIGSSMVGPSFQAYIAEKAPPGKVSSTYGLVNALFVVCMVIGPLLGGFLAEGFGFKTMIWIAVIVYAVATVMRVWLARGATFDLHGLRTASFVGDVRRLLVLLAGGGLLLWLFFVDGFADAGQQFVLPFLPTFATEVGGLSKSTYGAFYALMSVMSALAMWPGGIFADRFGERRGIAVGLALMGAIWFVVPLVPGAAVFALGFALAGVARSFLEPSFSSMLSKAVPRESLGMTWGIFWTALGVAAIPAPYIGGLMYDHISPESTFFVAAVCNFVAVPLALWKLRLPGAVKKLAVSGAEAD
jgi:DHA1 family multidrug resistance protein-like MFS transporter